LGLQPLQKPRFSDSTNACQRQEVQWNVAQITQIDRARRSALPRSVILQSRSPLITYQWFGAKQGQTMNQTRIALTSSMCRDARALLDITQEELAKAAAISVSTVRRCERGEAISEYAAKQIIAALEARGADPAGYWRWKDDAPDLEQGQACCA
jgi:DNA-binding transcriptional regulator YiaG